MNTVNKLIEYVSSDKTLDKLSLKSLTQNSLKNFSTGEIQSIIRKRELI